MMILNILIAAAAAIFLAAKDANLNQDWYNDKA